jgi:lysophospholipase L1-like esterase
MKTMIRYLKLRHFLIPVAVFALSMVFLQPKAAATDEKLVDFMGSSTVQFWSTMQTDFPQIEAVNLGVWGSDFSDLLETAPVYLHDHPANRFVIYSGDNDIATGKTAEQVLEKFSKLVDLIRTSYPDSQIFVISIKPCPVPDRRVHIPEIARANNLLRTFAEAAEKITYVDIFSEMLTPEGEPCPELFREDGLHLNAQGYMIWAKTLSPYLH